MIADKDGEGRQNGYAHGMNVRGTINDYRRVQPRSGN